MGTVYMSVDTDRRLIGYVESLGCKAVLTEPLPGVERAIAAHPDIAMCKLGVRPDSPVYRAEAGQVRAGYPACVPFNAVCLDSFFIHCLKYTDPGLLKAAKDMGLEPVNVNQGYTKCSCVVVDGSSVISADRGIKAALDRLPGISCLLIRPGFVELPGYDCGFLGGASGRVGDELIFNGNLSAHPDREEIYAFAESRGLRIKYFSDYPLTDVGSIIETL
ncbi:MAG: hypothetical protein IJG63_05715 [Oscillospiraceae bacterium]|nr:hypothetical protein [Oscillospiraceae bacterium]